jgi:hypothetical protein
MNTHVLLFGALVGVLTTASSDVAVVIGSRLGVGGTGPRRASPVTIGRWFAYMLKGQFHHASIFETPRLPGELPLGVAAHYVIGILFTFAFGLIMLALHVSSMTLPAVLFGLATVAFPWFLMLPSQGLGIMGRGARAPALLWRMSLYTHCAFGLALALWVTLLRPF